MSGHSALVEASLGDPLIDLAIAASIPARDIHIALRNALVNQTDFAEEIIVLNRLNEQRIYAAFAAQGSLGFLADIAADQLIIDSSAKNIPVRQLPYVTYGKGFDTTQLLVAPSPNQLRLLLNQTMDSNLANRVRIVAPTELQRAIEVHFRDQRVRDAVHSYATLHPEHSSRLTLFGWQSWCLGFLFGAGPALLFLFPSSTLFALHVFAWLFFFSCVILRLWAAMSPEHQPKCPLLLSNQAEYPKYAILVALYKEAEVASQLVSSLAKLNWPLTKLRVYLICEEDDLSTQIALETAGLPANFQIVNVPNYGPRTKPKALMYALPLVEADYLVLYDAEDRPDPDQLIEAYHKFLSSGPKTACVQAPLDITNSRHSILTSLFAFEYRALFHGLLPFLSHHNLFIPLGGTSNHFRVEVLRQIGGWDPFNVTEDADLGLRLHRYGYQTKTISLPTLEDAPEELGIWVKQRTRWFKGHMQTWMISLRNPRMLVSEIGWRSFLISQILLGGIIVSALAHPILLASIAFMAITVLTNTADLTISSPIAILDFINVMLGYFAFMLLGYVTTKRDQKAGIWLRFLAIPPYWVLLSYAAWRALFQILHAPHSWEKTPHKPTVVDEGIY